MSMTEDLRPIVENAVTYRESMEPTEHDGGHVTGQLERLQKLGAELAEQVDLLCQHLTPITRPEAQLAEKRADVPEPLRSPLGGRLASVGDHLGASIERLGDLRRSLDL